jgi:sulfinoalanine decarboxylase/sulfinoalanine decarboxylase/aspartate 1-decarboxylase
MMNQNDLDRFQDIVKQLLEAEKNEPVAKPIKAEALFEELDLRLDEEGTSDNVFYDSLKKLVMNTPRTATKQFFNQLFGGRKSKAVLGDLLSVMLNNSMYTYKVAGPMVGIEKEIIRRTALLVGYDQNAGGTIAPGGSMSNFMAMVMARDAFEGDVRYEGVMSKMIIYTSANCHYSIEKNAAMMGVGRKQVRYIPTNERGIMQTDALESQIEKDLASGFNPFFVNVTAGTTVLGAFDPIEETAEICKKHKLWLHIDGAYCGAVIFSNKYKELVKGAKKADSFSVNAHKMLGTPLTCSIVIAKNKEHLNDSFSNDARYLYQTDGDDYNLGKTSIQCGRRNDALKFWTLWKSIGTKGLEKLVDHQFYLADVARDYIRQNKDYQLYSYDNSVSVCFNYKNIPAEKLCTALYQHAELMVGFGTFKSAEFVRFVTINADNQKEDIINFFKTLEQFVEQHQQELVQPETAKT